MYIDLGAEQLLGTERSGEKIAVEIKIFCIPTYRAIAPPFDQFKIFYQISSKLSTKSGNTSSPESTLG